MPTQSDADLLLKIKTAVMQLTTVEKAATEAQAVLVSKSKAVGLLLLEAKRRHPAVKDFEAFLKKVHGLNLSRAYDLLRLAGGRTTDEELRKETRDRVKKHRDKKRSLPKPEPIPTPPPSVTSPHVTESAEISIDERRAQHADLLGAEEGIAKTSARALAEFTVACRTWLPKMNEADLQEACNLVATLACPKCREAA